MKKRLIGLSVALFFVLALGGCATNPGVDFKWGTATFKSWGDHELDGLKVVKKITKDGVLVEDITIELGSSAAKEPQANLEAMKATLEAIKALRELLDRIPAIPVK